MPKLGLASSAKWLLDLDLIWSRPRGQAERQDPLVLNVIYL